MRHAVVLVGLERMRIWASLILFSGLEDKPRDVIVTGAARARMCEKLAEALKMDRPDRFFLVGLFSVLDAIFDRPLEEILKTLPLAPDIAAGLCATKASSAPSCAAPWRTSDRTGMKRRSACG